MSDLVTLFSLSLLAFDFDSYSEIGSFFPILEFPLFSLSKLSDALGAEDPKYPPPLAFINSYAELLTVLFFFYEKLVLFLDILADEFTIETPSLLRDAKLF